MDIPKDLPLTAYYKLCDRIEKRINDLQFRGSNVDVVNDKIIEIPVDKKVFDECNELRIKLTEIKQLLEKDNSDKIREDIELLRKVILSRI